MDNYQFSIKDTKMVGEASTQPALRVPPLRDGRHQRLFQAALGLRVNRDDGLTMRDGDAFIILDGGREGVLVELIGFSLVLIGDFLWFGVF